LRGCARENNWVLHTNISALWLSGPHMCVSSARNGCPNTLGACGAIAPRAMTANRDLLWLVRAVASPYGKDRPTSSALHALGIRVRDAAWPHLTPPLAPPEEPFGPSDGRRACKINTGSPLPAALRRPAHGHVLTDASLRPHTHLVNFRATAAAAHYSFSTPPPDDGTPTHAPRHRACFTRTTVLLEPRNISYPICNRHATASSSCTPDRYTSPCAHQRLLSRDAAKGSPVVCVRTMRARVTAKSGRL
jgi:hypothetical protein